MTQCQAVVHFNLWRTFSLKFHGLFSLHCHCAIPIMTHYEMIIIFRLKCCDWKCLMRWRWIIKSLFSMAGWREVKKKAATTMTKTTTTTKWQRHACQSIAVFLFNSSLLRKKAVCFVCVCVRAPFGWHSIRSMNTYLYLIRPVRNRAFNMFNISIFRHI